MWGICVAGAAGRRSEAADDGGRNLNDMIEPERKILGYRPHLEYKPKMGIRLVVLLAIFASILICGVIFIIFSYVFRPGSHRPW